jgi:hypothetical protein
MATLLFAQQPLAFARGSEQNRDRQGAGAQLHTTVCLEREIALGALRDEASGKKGGRVQGLAAAADLVVQMR